METIDNNHGKIIKKDYRGRELGSVDTNKDTNFDAAYERDQEFYEASGDAVRTNPSRDNDDSEKEIDLDRSGPRYQQQQQQQQQQAAGIPTQDSSRSDRVARRAGQNAGVSGIGEGSAQGYEGNTDDSGLPQDEDASLSGSDEKSDIEKSIEVSKEASKNVKPGKNAGIKPHVSHG